MKKVAQTKKTDELDKMTFDAVVISGGASKGIKSLGTLYYHYEKGTFNMNDVKVYGATSIGAIICLLLVSGYSPMEILLKMKISKSPYSSEEFGEIWEIFKHMGFMSGETLINTISTLIKDKFGEIPSLGQLYLLTEKTLIVTGSNINKKICEYYSHKTYPDMSCIEAITFSSRLPILFNKIDREGDDIVDGGLTDNFPERYVDEVCKEMFGEGNYNILGVATKNPPTSNSFYEDIEHSQSYFFDKTMIGYMHKMVSTMLFSNMDLRCKSCRENTTLIIIDDEDENFEFLNPNNTQKTKMFKIGYETAEYKDTALLLYFPEWDNYLQDLLLPVDHLPYPAEATLQSEGTGNKPSGFVTLPDGAPPSKTECLSSSMMMVTVTNP